MSFTFAYYALQPVFPTCPPPQLAVQLLATLCISKPIVKSRCWGWVFFILNFLSCPYNFCSMLKSCVFLDSFSHIVVLNEKKLQQTWWKTCKDAALKHLYLKVCMEQCEISCNLRATILVQSFKNQHSLQLRCTGINWHSSNLVYATNNYQWKRSSTSTVLRFLLSLSI